MQNHETQRAQAQSMECELCIIGAGYAGLNALNAAAKYLPKGARVIVIDRNEGWGGQWLQQYDFVRLHQPYRMFTAGDQPWKLRADPWHRATRKEVVEHLISVPDVSAAGLALKPLFGHVYRGHRLRDCGVELEAVPVHAPDAAPVRIRARRMIKGTGADIEILQPLALASDRVRSVSVADPVLNTQEFLESDAPVYVIGSGKTAMDCVRHLAEIGQARRRAVNIVAGRGMWFLSRDYMLPRGCRRLFGGGAPASDVFLHMCQMFDGQNERAVMAALAKQSAAIHVFDESDNCRLGMISLRERDLVRAALRETYSGHLVDVAGTRMTLRQGKEQRDVAISQGSWIINCTSHLRYAPHEPVLQDSGLVCAPQYALGFTGTSAYYLTHMWFRGQLANVAQELFRFRIDVEPKLRFAPQMALMVMANMAMVTSRLPVSVASSFLGDLNKWFPLHRQLWCVARMTAARRLLLRKAEQLLKQRFSDTPEPAAQCGPGRGS